MAISKLNTVFAKHHRIIFGIFSVLIIVAFMDFLTPGTGIMDAFRGNGMRQSVGEIFGKKVSYVELGNQIQLDVLSMRTFMNIPVNSSMREQLEQQSFYNLANLAAAEKANIVVTDAEVGRFLRNFFRGQDGKFNAELYKTYVGNLAAEGYTENDLNEAARQYLTLAKLQSSMDANIMVTDDELKLFYNMLNSEYEVLLGEFSVADMEKSVKVDQKALDAYFAANRSKYVIPTKVNAMVVTFPYQKYRSQAIKSIKDADLKAYYEQNKQLFGKVKDGKFEIQEFDKVKNEVRSSAIAAKAKELAMNAAQQFAGNAYEAIGNADAKVRLDAFKKQLAAAKLTAVATGEFSADSPKAGTIAEPALVSELASVFADVPLSNAVPGKDAAYIGYATKLVPSRPAEFKEMAAAITKDFVKLEAYKAARSRADEVAAKLNAIPVESRVARVKAMAQPKFKAVKAFTLMNGSQELGYAAGAVAELLPGEMAKPIAGSDKIQLLVLASCKAPAKAYKADENLKMMYRNYKRSIQQMQYSAYLNANCKKYAEAAQAQAVAE